MLYADREIAPGKKGKIVVELQTSHFSGPLTGGVTLRTNDPGKKLYRLTVTVQITPLIEAQPDRIFLSGVSGEPLCSSVTITAHQKEPLVLTSHQAPSEDKLSWDLREIEPGRRYGLKVRCPDASSQVYRDRLVFRSNYPGRPYVVLPVLIRILPRVQAVPGAVDFGRISLPSPLEESSEAPERPAPMQQQSLFIRLNQGRDLAVLEVRSDEDALAWTVTPAIPGRVVRIDLRTKPGVLKPGSMNATLVVKTNQPGGDLKVPVTADVVPP